MITDEGDIVAPVEPRYLGLWLTGLFGDPDTTDNLEGSWDHEGPGGVQASFDFRGARNDVAGRMLTVTLTNDLDGSVYT